MGSRLPAGPRPRARTARDGEGDTRSQGARRRINPARRCDFARFRQEFLAPPDAAGNRLRNPGADFLDLLRRLLVIDNARRNVAFYESLKKFLIELVQAESSGLGRVDLDAVFLESNHASQRLANEMAKYRDRLDEFKARLGLSPRAAVVPSRTSVGAFEAGFRKVEDWVKQPNRSLTDLYRLIDQFPLADDVFVDGRPLLSRIDEAPDSMEAVLTEVVQLAVKNVRRLRKSVGSRRRRHRSRTEYPPPVPPHL